MPEFNYMTVSYICPECKTRLEHSLPFTSKNLRKINYVKGHWCTCGSRHKVEYKVSFKRNGEVKIKVVQFSSNDEIQTGKRFHVGTALN